MYIDMIKPPLRSSVKIATIPFLLQKTTVSIVDVYNRRGFTTTNNTISGATIQGTSSDNTNVIVDVVPSSDKSVGMCAYDTVDLVIYL
jgi:hypothetical protein